MKYNVTLNWILFFLIVCTVQVQSRDKTDENKIFKLSKSEKKKISDFSLTDLPWITGWATKPNMYWKTDALLCDLNKT